jgi:formiminotetrahydrofolate cyclodeaminase
MRLARCGARPAPATSATRAPVPYNQHMDNAPAVALADLTVGEFMERLASAEPVPGGGAASAVAGALGAALVSMVASLSTGRPKYVAYEATLARCQGQGRALAAEFLRLADEDATAYAAYAGALKLAKESEAEQETRRAAIRSAARVAADAPWACVQACTRLAQAAEALAGRSNVNAASDVLVAALLADAAAHGAAENVRINLPATGDEAYAAAMNRKLDAELDRVEELAALARQAVLAGVAREPEKS